MTNRNLTAITFFERGERFVCADVTYGEQSVSRLTADLAIAYTLDQGVTWKPIAGRFKVIKEMYVLDREHA